MEWRALAAATEDPELKEGRKIVEEAMKKIMDAAPKDVLPKNDIQLNPDNTIHLVGSVGMAGLGDSWYEYLLKMHLQGGSNEKEAGYRQAFEEKMRMMMKELVRESGGPVRVTDKGRDKMDHLACFVAGSLASSVHLPGAVSLTEEEKTNFMRVAGGIAETCYNMYHMSPSGLAPEGVQFDNRGKMTCGGACYNIQRPEAVEALFYLWRTTHEQKYRDYAWEIFQNFEKVLRVENGYVGLQNAWSPTAKNTPKDVMSSFFLAETIKYFYLIFSDDDVIPLDKWVFNTEAHPLKVDPSLGETPVVDFSHNYN